MTLRHDQAVFFHFYRLHCYPSPIGRPDWSLPYTPHFLSPCVGIRPGKYHLAWHRTSRCYLSERERVCSASDSDEGCNSFLHGCPCGFYGDPIKECSCSASSIVRYQKRISGPLLDRIDIHVEVPRVNYEKLAEKRQVENSETIRKRVQAAREWQPQRFTGTKLTCNAEMGPSKVRDFCNVEPSAEK